MGLEDLRLVNPCDHLSDESVKFATNAAFILKKATIYKSLAEALADQKLVIATSARVREKFHSFLHLHQLKDELAAFPRETPTALVFGRENSGLTNQEICLCNYWITIPTFGKSSSLNLAQAVLLVLYEFRKFDFKESLAPFETAPVANSHQIEYLKDHLFKILNDIQFIRPGKYESLWSSFSSLIGRAKPDERDVRMMRGIFNKIELSLGLKKKRRK